MVGSTEPASVRARAMLAGMASSPAGLEYKIEVKGDPSGTCLETLLYEHIFLE